MVLASSTLHGVVLSDFRGSLHFYQWYRKGELSLLFFLHIIVIYFFICIVFDFMLV